MKIVNQIPTLLKHRKLQVTGSLCPIRETLPAVQDDEFGILNLTICKSCGKYALTEQFCDDKTGKIFGYRGQDVEEQYHQLHCRVLKLIGKYATDASVQASARSWIAEFGKES